MRQVCARKAKKKSVRRKVGPKSQKLESSNIHLLFSSLLPTTSSISHNSSAMSSSLPALPTTNLLASKTVVVTGSSRGIGRACAIECARNGADVVLHHYPDDLSRKEVEEMRVEVERLGRRSVAIEGVRSASLSSFLIFDAMLFLRLVCL